MQIIRGDVPPNYHKIVKAFPAARRPGVIFAYGDKIFAPNAGEITVHLMKHEAVHGQRQKKIGVEEWWDRYIADPKFRYDEEVLAHRAEYLSMINSAMNRQQKRTALKFVAKRLASTLYGVGGSWQDAAKDIERQPGGFTQEMIEDFQERQNTVTSELEQNLKNTHEIYDRFQILANYIEMAATKQETLAMLEALSPLNAAINKKLDIEQGAQVQINFNDE